MIFEILVAFAASLAFAVIFDVSQGELIFCGLAGLAAEGVYQVMFSIYNENAAAFLAAAAVVTALARTFANLRKMPVTVYLVSGIIPLVPGAGMYKTVFNIIAADYAAAMYQGINTIKTAAALTIGIVLVFALPNKLFFRK